MQMLKQPRTRKWKVKCKRPDNDPSLFNDKHTNCSTAIAYFPQPRPWLPPLFPHERTESLAAFLSLAPFTKLLPKQPHRKEKRTMCCRGVLICNQTYELVQLYKEEGGDISFLSLISQIDAIISYTRTLHDFPLLHMGALFICHTRIQHMHTITQRHAWKVLFGA